MFSWPEKALPGTGPLYQTKHNPREHYLEQDPFTKPNITPERHYLEQGPFTKPNITPERHYLEQGPKPNLKTITMDLPTKLLKGIA
jgi:hypothetical protein